MASPTPSLEKRVEDLSNHIELYHNFLRSNGNVEYCPDGPNYSQVLIRSIQGLERDLRSESDRLRLVSNDLHTRQAVIESKEQVQINKFAELRTLIQSVTLESKQLRDTRDSIAARDEAQLSDALNKLTLSIDSIKTDVGRVSNEKETNISSLREKLSAARQTVSDREAERSSLNAAIKATQEEASKAKTETEAEISRLRTELQVAQSTISQKESECSGLRATLNEAQEQVEETDHKRAEAAGMVEQLTQKASDRLQDIQKLRDQIKFLEAQKSESNGRAEASKREAIALREQLVDIRDRLDETQQETRHKTIALGALQKGLDKKNERLVEQTRTVEDLEQRHATLRSIEEQHSTATSELQVVQEGLLQQKQVAKGLENELNTTKSSQEMQARQVAKAEEDLRQRTQQCDRLELMLEAARVELERTGGYLKECETKNKTLSSRLATMDLELKAAKADASLRPRKRSRPISFGDKADDAARSKWLDEVGKMTDFFMHHRAVVEPGDPMTTAEAAAELASATLSETSRGHLDLFATSADVGYWYCCRQIIERGHTYAGSWIKVDNSCPKHPGGCLQIRRDEKTLLHGAIFCRTGPKSDHPTGQSTHL